MIHIMKIILDMQKMKKTDLWYLVALLPLVGVGSSYYEKTEFESLQDAFHASSSYNCSDKKQLDEIFKMEKPAAMWEGMSVVTSHEIDFMMKNDVCVSFSNQAPPSNTVVKIDGGDIDITLNQSSYPNDYIEYPKNQALGNLALTFKKAIHLMESKKGDKGNEVDGTYQLSQRRYGLYMSGWELTPLSH